MTIIESITPILLEDLGMKYTSKKEQYKSRYGMYLCECGNKFETQIESVNSGNTKSCGCFVRRSITERSFVHGLSKTRLYRTYYGILTRCYNNKSKDYHRYGERGIRVCDEWRDDYVSFTTWANANGYKRELSIDRVDNDGNYEPSNCRFVTKADNTRNSSVAILTKKEVIEIKKKINNGWKNHILAKEYNVDPSTISYIKTKKTWRNV